jgi:hypothetical protein
VTADLLQRLNRAVPRTRAWIAQLVADSEPSARPVEALGFTRLPTYFPGALLRDTRVVAIGGRLPFPPVSSYELPEFKGVEDLATTGISFTNLFFVHESLPTESVHFHELVHVIQWRTLGVDDFCLSYALGLLQHGYAKSPLEAMAFDLQSQFDRGAPVPDMAAAIVVHARRSRDEAAQVFRQHGLTMGA